MAGTFSPDRISGISCSICTDCGNFGGALFCCRAIGNSGAVLRKDFWFLITTQAKRNLSSRSGIGGVLSAT